MKRFGTSFLYSILILVPYFLQAQNNKALKERSQAIDSLHYLLTIAKEDTNKVNTLNILSKQYINTSKYKQAMQYVQQAELLAGKLNYKKGIADSYNNFGLIYWYKGEYEKALDYDFKSLKIQVIIGDKKGRSASYNNIGLIYWNQGKYEIALDNFEKSLKIRKEIGDKKGIAANYNNIGLIYDKQGNYEKSLDNLLKSLKIKEEIGDKHGMESSYNNIGNIYLFQGSFEKALDNYFKSLKIGEELGNKNGIATSYNNIGIVYNEQENYENALDNYLKSIKISEEIGDKRGIAMSYNNMGGVYYSQFEKSGTAIKIYDISQYSQLIIKSLESYLEGLKIYKEIGEKQGIAYSFTNIGKIYLKEGKLEESFYYLNQSLIKSKEIGYKDGVKESYYLLSEFFEKKGDYKQAFNYHKLYSDIKDTLLNEQSSKQIAEMSTKYDSEKKDKELIKKDAEIAKQQIETEKQNLQRNAFIIGFGLVLVLAFFIFRSYRQKRNANHLLEEKNVLIEKQKLLVEEKNIKITDSINYAKRIQQAILPSQELIKSFLPESFVFFRPKDIVSGDFYWFTEKQDKLIIAVADCTGHGVPGAFMSMIGNTLLNEIINVKNISDPAQILNHLNKGIVKILHQDGNDSNTQDDGMDITILAINKTNPEIEFAGANHFAYIFNKTKLETLKGDVFSIGGMYGSEDINFSSQKIEIEKGNTLYLFTDGFVDQFGGEKNTKFLSGRFEVLLKNIQHNDMEHQKENLITAFDEWKGNNKQLDDILVVGIHL